MSVAAAPTEDTAEIACAETLEWRIHLARGKPQKLIGLIAAFALILTCGILTFHSLIVGMVGCIVTLGAVKEYIAPLNFQLDENGAKVAGFGVMWVEMPWSNMKSVYRTGAGLKLSPFRDPKTARTESLRGITLRFPQEMAAEVERFVARRAGGGGA